MTDKDKEILDACCGSRLFWLDKQNQHTVYMDSRECEQILCDGRKLKVCPDIVADFRDMPFKDETFNLVVFDPPHLVRAGEKSFLAAKYGKLNKDTWRDDLAKGFSECWRVLKVGGTLIFKWSENQIKVKDVLNLFSQVPLFGNRDGKNGHTLWLVFYKNE